MASTQPYHEPSFLKEVWSLFAVGCFVYLLRFIVRLRAVGIKGFQGDDYVSFAVLACYTVDAITVTLCYEYGTNVDYTPKQLAEMSPSDQANIEFGSRMQLLAWYTYTGLVWGLKATMLFFFNRLTFGLRQQLLVKWLAVVVGITYVAVFLTITFSCFPTQRNWQVVPYPGLTCTFKPQNFYVSTVLNVITDAAVLAIPLPLMWALQVSWQKKITLMALLSSGVFVISAAIIRIVMTLVAHPSALTINRWGVRETIAGIIAVNLPIIKPIFTKNFWSKNFPPKSQKSSSGRTGPGNGSDATNARGRIRNAFSRRIEAYELNDGSFHDQSRPSQTEKRFEGRSEVVEVDSNSDMHPMSNRSSEDLVVQIPSKERRPSCAKYEKYDEDLEVGPESPPRVEVLVEQTYNSRSQTAGTVDSSSWTEERHGWTGVWPRYGLGNRVTIEARDGSQGRKTSQG